MKGSDVQRIPLQLSQDCVVASIQVDLTEKVLQQFRQDLLERLHQTHAKGLILDLSGVEIMDFDDFQALNSTLSMVAIMGVKTVLCGFQPGVVSSLVDLNADIDQITAALDLDDAFLLMEKIQSEKTIVLSEEEQDHESLQFSMDWDS